MSLEEDELSREGTLPSREPTGKDVEDLDDLVEQDEEEEEIPAEAEESESDYIEEPEHGSAYGVYSDEVINDSVFEELRLPSGLVDEIQTAWKMFLDASGRPELAGEAIYGALFDAAPSLQSLYKTPRAVQAMKFAEGLNAIVQACGDPPNLKVVVEGLGFRHLDIEVTTPRAILMRDAIIELFGSELGSSLPPNSVLGLRVLLNYVGGAFIYVRVQFAERLKIISSSWATATCKGQEERPDPMTSVELMNIAASHADVHQPPPDAVVIDIPADEQDAGKGSKMPWKKGGRNKGGKKQSGQGSGSGEKKSMAEVTNAVVPKTYTDMFLFNSAVMGFGSKVWMHDILMAFDAMVTNISSTSRLQEECDVLALAMSKHQGPIVLNEYKAVMLASLRSLVRAWDSQHELAWSWLWENVERMLKAVIHKPALQQQALQRFYSRLDETAMQFVRREVYIRFFAMAPTGQDYFKQSTTRLHFIVDKMTSMTLEMYQTPKTMVNDLSAMGLRHVGYGIPVDMFNPFVTAAVETIREIAQNDAEAEAFSWSLNLISRILCRVISEGSTIVMKAINANSAQMLRKAVSCAPRGERAAWVLHVQVGTQSISPLLWAIQAGSLDASRAIINDLLTIRADRDNYYFGADYLFERHPDIIKRLTLDAPALLPAFLDGFIWRSRNTENGQRRVNYWLKHFLVDSEGNFSQNIEWLVNFNDPKLICHPVAAIAVDLVWNNVAFRTFLFNKTWFLFTTCIFICSQSILTHATASGNGDRLSLNGRIVMLVFRCFIYVFSMGEMILKQSRLCIRDIKEKNLVRVGRIPIPAYLCKWQNACSFALMMCLISMFCVEPIVHCLFQGPAENFTRTWCRDEPWRFIYAMLSTMSILLYFILMSDFTVFSTRISAFTLVCSRLISELFLFLFAATICTLAFACSIAALRQDNESFSNTYDSFLHLWKVVLNMMTLKTYETMEDDTPALFIAVAIFIIVVCIFLMSLFVAQLSSAYQATFEDMVGYARLNRGQIVVATMPSVPEFRWQNYIASLRLGHRIEFGEGDIGLAGGIQVMEPGSLNPTLQEKVQRFAGTTSRQAPWPHEDVQAEGEDLQGKLERMEKLLELSMKKIQKLVKGGNTSSKGYSGSLSGSAMPDQSGSSGSS